MTGDTSQPIPGTWRPSAGFSGESHYAIPSAEYAICGAKVLRRNEADRARPKCPACAWRINRERRAIA